MPLKRQLIREILEVVKHVDLKPTKNGELSTLQIRTLVYVRNNGCVKPSDLAKEFNVTPATVTVQIDKLVAGKWLERCYDNNDRRVINISLTKKAEGELDDLVEKTLKKYDWMFEALSNEDQEELLKIAKKVHEQAHRDDGAQK